jgi:hypothetical protein
VRKCKVCNRPATAQTCSESCTDTARWIDEAHAGQLARRERRLELRPGRDFDLPPKPTCVIAGIVFPLRELWVLGMRRQRT